MIGPRKKWDSIGGSVPLFDRLIDLNPEIPEEPVPLFNYNKNQLIDSVIREASNLLNTRCKIPYKDYEDMDPSTLTYGVPELYGLFDSSYADPSRSEDRIKLCRFIANTLQMFEPRLHDIAVEIDRYDQSKQLAYLNVQATLKVGKMVEVISFPVELEQTGNLGKSHK